MEASSYEQQLQALEKRLGWPTKRVAAERQRALRSLFAHAVRRAPFYARRLAHLDPATATEADLARVPPLGKAELMAHWDEIVTVPGLTLERCEAHLRAVSHEARRLGGHRIFATGGSSGVRAIVPYSDAEWRLFGLSVRRFMMRAAGRMGLAVPERPVTAQVHAGALTHMSGMLGVGAEGIAMHAFPVTLPLSELVERLNALQPHGVSAYASVLRTLAEEALAGRLDIRPQSLVTGGEPLSEEDAEVLRKAWNALVFDAYGSTEAGMLAVGESTTPGLTLNEDLVIVEPVDRDGRPIAPGERSAKLYVTPLHHRSLPLLRYELLDEVVLLEEPCPHGSAFRRIGRVRGRVDDGFVYRGGLRVHPAVFRSPLTRRSAITAYQVRQSERGADIAVVANGPFDAQELAREIASGLASVGLADPWVSVERVSRIPRTAHSAKLRRFVPLSEPPS